MGRSSSLSTDSLMIRSFNTTSPKRIHCKLIVAIFFSSLHHLHNSIIETESWCSHPKCHICPIFDCNFLQLRSRLFIIYSNGSIVNEFNNSFNWLKRTRMAITRYNLRKSKNTSPFGQADHI